jgi:hypothetical protein
MTAPCGAVRDAGRMLPSRTRESFWVDGLYLDGLGFYGFDGKMDSETFSTAGRNVGHNNMPALLFDLVQRGAVDIVEHPAVVVEAWMMAEFPASKVDPGVWVDWFENAGYTHDGRRSPRPAEPLTLYRGCAPERRFGMSWTTHLDRARWFADRDLGHGKGKVYVYDTDPMALLAFIDEPGRHEAEYVVDPWFLSDDVVKMLDGSSGIFTVASAFPASFSLYAWARPGEGVADRPHLASRW